MDLVVHEYLGRNCPLSFALRQHWNWTIFASKAFYTRQCVQKQRTDWVPGWKIFKTINLQNWLACVRTTKQIVDKTFSSSAKVCIKVEYVSSLVSYMLMTSLFPVPEHPVGSTCNWMYCDRLGFQTIADVWSSCDMAASKLIAFWACLVWEGSSGQRPFCNSPSIPLTFPIYKDEIYIVSGREMSSRKEWI